MKRHPFRYYELFAALAGVVDGPGHDEVFAFALVLMDAAIDGHEWGAHVAIEHAYRPRGGA